jgi:Complex 1 protein (LYR family)
MLDRHLAGGQQPYSGPQNGLVSTRRDALHLYRQIYRYTSLFEWRDDRGEIWRDKLRASARSEFEASRSETDPAVITKLLLNSRDAIDQIVDRFLNKRRELEKQGALPRRLT